MPKGYLIDSTKGRIEAVEFADLAGLQALIGCSIIEGAYQWENGDVLYVDEEGLLKDEIAGFFAIPERPDQPLAGNGMMVGREIEGDEYPNGYTNLPPTMTLADLVGRVRFLREF